MRQSSATRSALKQKVFVAALLVLGLAVSWFVVLRADPRAALAQGSARHGVRSAVDAGAKAR